MTLSSFLMENWPYTVAIVVVFIAIMVLEAKTGGSKRGIRPDKAISVINAKKSMIIDIRPAEKFAEGHIPRARNMQFEALKKDKALLKKQKNNPTLVTCERGISCKPVVKWLVEQGFDAVYELEGGMSAWRKAKLPTTKDEG